MKTASFFGYKGAGRISIARYAPKGHADVAQYPALAPGKWFNKVTDEEYRRLFAEEILGVLDPQVVWDELHQIADGAEPVLLCWEKRMDLDSGKTFCHRRIVAAWLEEKLGHVVPELMAGFRARGSEVIHG
jgi:hypothetical protein